MKLYKLIGADGKQHVSTTPGLFGGHRGGKGYGRLDCPCAARWIAKGYYVNHRVFFADEATAIAAGYRPAACCLKERYAVWKQVFAQSRDRGQALLIYKKMIGLTVGEENIPPV